MARLFGTDGVRGIVNKELTCELALKLGRAGAQVLATGTHKPRILIGRDTRVSGQMLAATLAAGIVSTGAEAVDAGVIPTPGVSHLVQKLGFDAGIVISASHNPAAYNGIKFFASSGSKLPDETEDRIEQVMNSSEALPAGVGMGSITAWKEAGVTYARDLGAKCGLNLSGLKVVLDCANGASAALAPELFRSLGAKVTAIHCDPNGTNINDACGSTKPDDLCKAVVREGADLGLAFDGDADRMIACDGQGQICDGDTVMGLLALDMKARGALKHDTLVVTVMSNMGLELAMQKNGIHLVKTAVGDRYVWEAMEKEGYNLGGEQSGHVLISDLSITGDGMQTGLMLCDVVLRSGQPLSELRKAITILPQVLVGAHVRPEEKARYNENEEIAQQIAALETKYSGIGRVLIRPSGTEHLIRVMIEGPDRDEMEQDARALAALMEKKLG
ncbi:MAG: phosphoglucosamine mutase [Clostridia bacterium]|nr:phosphoglucosamine mutase [Clostridia bacterium]